MQMRFIIFTILVVVIIGGLGLYFGFKPQVPGKLDTFAQALKEKGAMFYGAFWCPHCIAQKAEFGTSKQYLPYIECSNPDNSQKQICIDNKIESYPTWTFKDGITLISDNDPLICEVITPTSVEIDACKNKSSEFYRTWLFPDRSFSIKSSTNPIKKGTLWIFPSGAQASGEVPLIFLAEQIQFTFPQ